MMFLEPNEPSLMRLAGQIFSLDIDVRQKGYAALKEISRGDSENEGVSLARWLLGAEEHSLSQSRREEIESLWREALESYVPRAPRDEIEKLCQIFGWPPLLVNDQRELASLTKIFPHRYQWIAAARRSTVATQIVNGRVGNVRLPVRVMQSDGILRALWVVVKEPSTRMSLQRHEQPGIEFLKWCAVGAPADLREEIFQTACEAQFIPDRSNYWQDSFVHTWGPFIPRVACEAGRRGLFIRPFAEDAGSSYRTGVLEHLQSHGKLLQLLLRHSNGTSEPDHFREEWKRLGPVERYLIYQVLPTRPPDDEPFGEPRSLFFSFMAGEESPRCPSVTELCTYLARLRPEEVSPPAPKERRAKRNIPTILPPKRARRKRTPRIP